MKQLPLKAGTVATIVHTLYPENNIKMCYSASFINNIKGFLRQIAGLHGLDWTGRTPQRLWSMPAAGYRVT